MTTVLAVIDRTVSEIFRTLFLMPRGTIVLGVGTKCLNVKADRVRRTLFLGNEVRLVLAQT